MNATSHTAMLDAVKTAAERWSRLQANPTLNKRGGECDSALAAIHAAHRRALVAGVTALQIAVHCRGTSHVRAMMYA